MKKVYPPKDPQETLPYGFNWSPRDIGSQRIVTINATVVSGTITIPTSQVGEVPGAQSGQGTVHVISGGADGEMAEIRLTATTDAVPANIMEQTVYLPIRQK